MATVQRVLAVLEHAGFERLPKPLTVAGTEFDFEAAVRGTRTSHDLVLVATDEIPHARLQRLIAGLARSLDIAASNRPMSLVLIGEVAAADRAEFERYVRVLPIESTTPDDADIEQAIAVLLPLKLPNTDLVHGSDPINEVLALLGPAKATSDYLELVRAAADGPDTVREALRQYMNDGAGWADEAGENDE